MPHIKSPIKNVSCRLSKLKKVRNFLSESTALRIYKTMILPIFDYGDVFYHNNNIKYLNKLQILKNKAIHIFFKLYSRTNTEQDQTALYLLDLHTRRNLHQIEFAFELSFISENI